MSENNSIKCVLIGDNNVGKTQFCYTAAKKNENIKTTISGVNYNVSGKNTYCIWDTAGQEMYRSMVPYYFRDSKIVLIFYDVTRRTTFDSLPDFVKLVKDTTRDTTKIVLIGNKIDLEAERFITKEQGQQLAQQLKAEYYEISAKMDKPGVDAIFEKIAHKTVKEAQKMEKDDTKSVGDISQKNSNKKGCC